MLSLQVAVPRFCKVLWLVVAAVATVAIFPAIPSAEAQAPAAVPDRVLVVGTKEAPPFAMKESDGSWTGISIELWRRIADELHLRYRFREVSLEQLTDDTAAGKLDAAIAAITVSAKRAAIVDFTQPYYTTGLGIAVPRQTTFNWLELLGSLLSLSFVQALIGLIGVTFLIGMLVWVFERRHTEHFSGVKAGLATSVWWSALTLTQSVPEHGPKTLPGRFLAVVWMAASVAAIAVFTAGITSHLTTKQLEGAVHRVADLRSVRVGVVAGTTSRRYLERERIKFRTYPSAEAGLKAIKAGTLDALVYDRPLLSWLTRSGYEDSVEVLDLTFDQQNYAVALPNNSALRMPINRALLAIIGTQWWRDLNEKYLGSE